ncbi:MAG TPA: pseudouridine synthase [Polyangiaceae bacterium]|nr:pseudouridine synthase [Polyangiaceae bacterium]
MASDESLRVLFEDARLLVVAKPSGVAVHSGASASRDTIVSRLVAAGRPPHVAHRLDAATTGALVVAKDRLVARELAAAFERGAIEKRYLAWVRGVPPARATVDHPIPKDEGGSRVPAVTDVASVGTIAAPFSTLREKRYTLVLARPRTGRFHQIRRHLKHLGCPLVGDANYGKSEHNRFARDHLGLGRLGLHAFRVSLAEVGGPAWIEAPLPEDMAAPFAAVGVTMQPLVDPWS